MEQPNKDARSVDAVEAAGLSEALDDIEYTDALPTEDDGEQSAENIGVKAALAVGAVATVVAAPAAGAAHAGEAAPTQAAAPASAVTKQKEVQGPGAQKLAKMCGDSDAAICKVPKWPEAHLTFDSVVIGRYVAQNWPEIKIVGGWRPSDPYPDHPSGRAVDIMMPNGGQGKDKALGNEIAKYFQEHAKEFGVEYILWRQQTWSVGDGPNGWRAMEDRGSPTANHMDHVHITVKGDKNTIAKKLIEDTAARAPIPVSATAAVDADQDMFQQLAGPGAVPPLDPKGGTTVAVNRDLKA